MSAVAERMPLVVNGVRPLTEAEFKAFQSLVYGEAGIHLSAAKKPLLVGRLTRRVRALGLDSFAAYYDHVQRDALEKVHMLDAICTNETHFFREPRQFEYLAERVYPAWAAAAAAGERARKIRVWSAACSSGEEPYSLAMSLLSRFPAADGWTVEIVASDLSTKVLARAQSALWPMDKAAEIPEPLLRRFMLRGIGSQEGWMKAGPEIRSVVSFTRANLNDDRCPVAGPFDLVFCRNVLIYFDAQSKAAVIRRLQARLAPEGLLFLGHAESLNGLTDRMKSVGPTVYAFRS
jgi:chemotaxis protein methyltransferase CheR